MKIFLIRHGETKEASSGIMQNIEADLNGNGKNHIKDLRERLRDVKFDTQYSSPQTRAKQSADILWGENNYEVLDYINEYVRPDVLDGRPREEGFKFWEETHIENKYDPDWKLHNSESFNDIIGRAKKLRDFIYDTHKNDDVIGILGHGVFFRHFLGIMALGDAYTPDIFFKLLFKMQLDNGKYIMLDIADTDNRYELSKIYYDK